MDDEIDWSEEGNFTEDGELYYYHIIAYKSGTAIGCAYSASNDQSDKSTAKDSSDESVSDSKDSDKPSERVAPNVIAGDNPVSENHNSIVKSIDLGNLKDSLANNDTQNTSNVNKINNETAVPATNNSEMGIFALLLSLLVSLVVII